MVGIRFRTRRQEGADQGGYKKTQDNDSKLKTRGMNTLQTWLVSALTAMVLSWGGMIWHTGERLAAGVDEINETLHEYMVITNERIARVEKDAVFCVEELNKHRKQQHIN